MSEIEALSQVLKEHGCVDEHGNIDLSAIPLEVYADAAEAILGPEMYRRLLEPTSELIGQAVRGIIHGRALMARETAEAELETACRIMLHALVLELYPQELHEDVRKRACKLRVRPSDPGHPDHKAETS